MEKNIEIFDPHNKSFCFRMDQYDCFYCKTGICSLDLTSEERQHYRELEGTKDDGSEAMYNEYPENSVMYCYLLAENILVHGYRTPCTTISGHSCGHYTVGEGQHRACIGKRMGIQIPVQKRSHFSGICGHCEAKSTKRKYRIGTRFKEEPYFFIC